MRSFPMCLGFGVVVLIGLGIFGLGARNLWRAFASVHWPTAAATVVESSGQVSGGGRGSMYTANLKFQYEVSGRTYRTDQIYIGQTVASGDASESELRRFRYPMGAKVTVSYNPSDPSIASVHPGFQADVLWMPGAGLAFLLPTLMAFVMFRSTLEGTSGMGVGLAIFGLIFMTIGGIILFFGGRALWRGWQSQNWPPTRGTIVFNLRDKSQSTARTSDDQGISATAHAARLIFRFEVDGREHFSNTRQFGQLSASDEEWADRIANRYPLGSEVKVWYRPDSPDLATLEPGITSDAYWTPGAGAVFLLFGLAALFLVRRI